jgi:uncharacterized protein (DUF1501 family)
MHGSLTIAQRRAQGAAPAPTLQRLLARRALQLRILPSGDMTAHEAAIRLAVSALDRRIKAHPDFPQFKAEYLKRQLAVGAAQAKPEMMHFQTAPKAPQMPQAAPKVTPAPKSPKWLRSQF